MTTDFTQLDQRLTKLSGQGQAPSHLWQGIEAKLNQQQQLDFAVDTDDVSRINTGASVLNTQFIPAQWAQAAMLCLVLISTFVMIGRPQHSASDTDSFSAITPSISALNYEAQAIDQQQQQLQLQLARVIDADSGYEAALINPELQAIQASRQQVRQALEAQPDSALLLQQLTRLDQWQHRLLRTMAQRQYDTIDLTDEPGMSV